MDAAARSTMTLADGRMLAWTEYGDPDGVVVLNHHGGLLSASDVAPLDDDARTAGVRLVSFDRPGIGGSTPSPRRTMGQGAADAEELLDHLGVGDVRLFGWSMGGQYALATAYRLGSRVRRTTVVAGCLPLDDPATMAELNVMDRQFTASAFDHERRLHAASMVWGGLAHFSPRIWAVAASHGEPDIDGLALRVNREPLAESAVESTEEREGWAEEYRAWALPWGFDLADVTTPVDVWQGTADHLVHASWARRMAEALPCSTLHLVEGEGHFLMLNEAAQVFAVLVGAQHARLAPDPTDPSGGTP